MQVYAAWYKTLVAHRRALHSPLANGANPSFTLYGAPITLTIRMAPETLGFLTDMVICSKLAVITACKVIQRSHYKEHIKSAET